MMVEMHRRLYRAIRAIRRFEETAYDLYGQRVMLGPIHTSIGQEAVAVGVCDNLRPDDLASKLAFEQCLPWMHDMSCVAFRYFNVCGATEHVWERPYHRSRIIPVAMDVARGRLPSMPLNGTDYQTSDGTCVRDYLHVDDVAEAHVLALEKPRVTGVFNLGIGTWYSNREVIQTVERITGKTITVIEGPRRQGDPRSLVAKSDKAQLELGWRPRYKSLEAMIESAWKYEP